MFLLFWALAIEFVVVALVGEQLGVVGGGAETAAAAVPDGRRKHQATASHKLERMLRAIGGAQQHVTIGALTNARQAQPLGAALRAIVA